MHDRGIGKGGALLALGFPIKLGMTEGFARDPACTYVTQDDNNAGMTVCFRHKKTPPKRCL